MEGVIFFGNKILKAFLVGFFGDIADIDIYKIAVFSERETYSGMGRFAFWKCF